MSLDHALRNLRHLYEQMVNGHVVDQRSAADGLLSPAVAMLEREQGKRITGMQSVGVLGHVVDVSTDEDPDDMCPNCCTPWKCNGPHLKRDPNGCWFDPGTDEWPAGVEVE